MLCIPPMHLERRLAAGLACAVALLAPDGRAQPASPPSPPETLETPYADTPPTAPPPDAPRAPETPSTPVAEPLQEQPPAAPQVVSPLPQADKRPLGPIRARRKLALTGELGFNGLAGFGPVLTYNVNPHFSLELGGGLSVLGWKAGLRGRYNFMTTPLTPFIGAGFLATSGLGQFTIDPSDDPNGDPKRLPIILNVKPSYLVQGVLGFDFIHKHGFTMVGCLGYAWLLNHDNVEVLAGSLKDDERQAINFFFKSGAVVSLATGYAFE